MKIKDYTAKKFALLIASNLQGGFICEKWTLMESRDNYKLHNTIKVDKHWNMRVGFNVKIGKKDCSTKINFIIKQGADRNFYYRYRKFYEQKLMSVINSIKAELHNPDKHFNVDRKALKNEN